ncbi:MAG: VCBS repeat-containing protein [Phycisphaerales bacterium]|nr:VCBS repeat-containing protein [Phycisphaerales bacterium]MCB9858622.1 VCBS repeat-containing protein [Phycisphaerales bacterium]
MSMENSRHSFVSLLSSPPVEFASSPIMASLHNDASAVATHRLPIQSGDLDGDGHVDLFAALNNSTSVGVAFGAGDGSFAQAAPQAGATYDQAGFGDFDGDDLMDIVVKAFGDSDKIQTLLQQAGRMFDAQSSKSVPAVGERVFPARDFDGDDVPDLMYLDPFESGGLELVQFQFSRGKGDGTFLQPTPFATFNRTSASVDGELGPIALGDFNGDGLLDFVLVYNSPAPEVVIGIAKTMGAGVENFLVTRHDYGNVATAITSDLNQDGLADLILQELREDGATTGGEFVHIFYRSAEGGFSGGVIEPSELPRAIAVGQLTDDAFPDIVIMTGSDAATPGPLAIYVNRGDETYSVEQTLDVSALASAFLPLIVDTNEDGKADIVVGDASNRNVAVFLQQ